MGGFYNNENDLKFDDIIEDKNVIELFDFQNNQLHVNCKFETAEEYRDKLRESD